MERDTHHSTNTPPRSALFATRARVARFAVAGIGVQLLLAVVILLTAKNGVDALGIQLGFDFVVFHEASRLAQAGDLAQAFEQEVLLAALRERIGDLANGHYWLYPPTFALMILPLGLAPFGVAFWLWTGAGLAAYVAGVRQLATDRLVILSCLAYTAVWSCGYHGQNGFFTAACFMTAAAALLKRRDKLAGLAIALLAIKPHLAVLFPLYLAHTARWRAFFMGSVFYELIRDHFSCRVGR